MVWVELVPTGADNRRAEEVFNVVETRDGVGETVAIRDEDFIEGDVLPVRVAKEAVIPEIRSREVYSSGHIHPVDRPYPIWVASFFFGTTAVDADGIAGETVFVALNYERPTA